MIAPFAPAVVRAATFYGDSLWGNIITTLAALYMPDAETLTGKILRALLFTVALVLFERWLKGDLHFFADARTSAKHHPVGPPDTGVLLDSDY